MFTTFALANKSLLLYMKRLLIIAFMMSICGQIVAADFDYFILRQTDGTVTALSSANLRITFSDGNLVATSSSGSTTLPLTTMEAMFFSDTDLAGIKSVSNETGTTGVVIYNMSGVAVAKGDSMDDAVKSLRSGLYIVKKGSTVKKIQLR